VGARTWFVTGGSSGLGRALVVALLARGERVAATARDVSSLADLVSTGDGALWTMSLDLTDHAQIRSVVSAAIRDLGHLDVVVSNAGYGLVGAAEEASDEQVRRQLDTNLLGPVQLVRAVLPHLRARAGGRIYQISSSGGQCAVPGMSLYHASKWGVEGFFEALAAEVRAMGIGVTIVEPGAMPTGFNGRSRDTANPMPEYASSPAGRTRRALDSGTLACPGDVAKVAAAIIASADQSKAPLRLTLGSDAYRMIRSALVTRLSALDRQQELARSTDA
jgi:NAD(P)-dependent dehydrogenase (short-subunit alcohol dehydrogenase family)